MKLLHLQIFAAAMAIGLVGAGVGAMQIHAGKQEADRKLAKAESDLKSLRGATSLIGAGRPKGGRDLEKENADLASRVRTLEARVGALERENALLKQSLQRSTEGPAHAKPIPGGGMTPSGPAPVAAGASDPGIPIAAVDAGIPSPPVDVNESWGASEDSELDEIAAIVKMSPEQRDKTRDLIRDGQNKFLRLLQEAGAAGEKDITIIEKLGNQVYQETRGGISSILRPEQRGAWDEYLKKQEEMR